VVEDLFANIEDTRLIVRTVVVPLSANMEGEYHYVKTVVDPLSAHMENENHTVNNVADHHYVSRLGVKKQESQNIMAIA
jgi:hypothetical protein